MRILFILIVSLVGFSKAASADIDLDFFDAHIHYSKDMWSILPPKQAVILLSEAGIKRALVSATPGEGAERLYHAAPEIVVPFLRPYATPKHRYTWYKDRAILDYLNEQLVRIPYQGIGEFHLPGVEVNNPVVIEVVKLARKKKLALHAHTDEAGINGLLEHANDIPVIWAHGGFDVPEKKLQQLLSRYKNLYIELSYREGITEQGQLTPIWYKLLTRYQTRFFIGMDTYLPGRWVSLPELANETRQWLQQLPKKIARDIAFDNAARLFPRKK